MKEIKGIFPVFKALMAIVYLLLGAVILVYPTLLLPVHNSFGTVFGIVLMLYGIIRLYISFSAYTSFLKEKRNEEL
jgi:uncharacterized membrane protein HdeD (DUF308 family)